MYPRKNFYAGDPRWITARFDSTGACGHPIKRGQEIFYFPRGKHAYCVDCSKAHSDRFDAECFDEEFGRAM